MGQLSGECKLFVGGISRETTNETLRQHFAKYGNVDSVSVATDRITGMHRGFGFVTFSEHSQASLALQDTHEILGRTVDVKKARPRFEVPYIPSGRTDDYFRTAKIFVGGLSSDLMKEEFKNYFEKFGKIVDVVIIHDNITNRPRGFGFITFDTKDAVDEVLQNHFHELNGRRVEVKRAIPREYNPSRHGSTRCPDYTTHPNGSYLPYSSYGSYLYLRPYGGFPGYTYGNPVFGSPYHVGGYNGSGYAIAPYAGGTYLSVPNMRTLTDPNYRNILAMSNHQI